MLYRGSVIAGVLLTLSAPAHACWDQAGVRYGVDPWLLYGIAKTESSLNPAAVNRSHYSRTQSYDIGLMQINSRWLSQLAAYGITRESLFDPCTNINVGAWILAHTMRQHGPTWEAVGAYNAACTQLKGEACQVARSVYVWKVYRNLQGAAR